MGGYNHWTGLLDWTTGHTQTAKYTSFSAEHEAKRTYVFTQLPRALTLVPTAYFLEFLEVKGHVHI